MLPDHPSCCHCFDCREAEHMAQQNAERVACSEEGRQILGLSGRIVRTDSRSRAYAARVVAGFLRTMNRTNRNTNDPGVQGNGIQHSSDGTVANGNGAGEVHETPGVDRSGDTNQTGAEQPGANDGTGSTSNNKKV